jgi:hypothetical protein
MFPPSFRLGEIDRHQMQNSFGSSPAGFHLGNDSAAVPDDSNVELPMKLDLDAYFRNCLLTVGVRFE